MACAAGALAAAAMPIPSTHSTIAVWFGWAWLATMARPTLIVSCTEAAMIRIARRLYRSASTPPNGESRSIGPSWANVIRPTNAASWVRWSANEMSAMFCIQVPMFDAKVPR